MIEGFWGFGAVWHTTVTRMAVCRARWRARVRAELPHVARLGDAVSRVLLADDAMRTAVGAARAMTDAQKLLRAAGLTVGDLVGTRAPATAIRDAWRSWP